MNAYTPRRCSARWLDGDCPPEVLAIIHTRADELVQGFDVLYTETFGHDDPRGPWLSFLDVDTNGHFAHGEMTAWQAAQYRYRNKHRYAKWSTLPDAVKNAVRRDIADAKKWTEENA